MPSPTYLESALTAVPNSLESLTFAHVTIGKWLSALVSNPVLRPKFCDVLARDVVYLSYGAPYYKPANRQTEEVLELPVAFVFGAELVAQISRFYPFDTGAVAGGRFGKALTGLDDFDQLYIRHEPQRLVSCFYKTNERYLRGEVQRSVPRVAPLPLIRRFLAQNLADLGADNRHRTIECVSENPVDVLEHLKLVVYPEPMSRMIRQMWEAAPPGKFEFKSYETDSNENPAALVTHIAKVVREEMRHTWEGP